MISLIEPTLSPNITKARNPVRNGDKQLNRAGKDAEV
jgi:hypothetical protein